MQGCRPVQVGRQEDEHGHRPTRHKLRKGQKRLTAVMKEYQTAEELLVVVEEGGVRVVVDG